MSTLRQLLAAGDDAAIALAAPGRTGLDYRGLRALVADTLARLNAIGVRPDDRVAIVLPNGPEMAACFLACAAGTASAPLNPAYRADEFEFYLSDLDAKVLIVERGSTSPAVEVARRLGVRVVELSVPDGAAAGHFVLDCGADGAAIAAAIYAEPQHIAMVLHTSGTTSRPKIVPLSVANLCASAANIRRTLAFTPADVGLNIMPLFHPTSGSTSCRCSTSTG